MFDAHISVQEAQMKPESSGKITKKYQENMECLTHHVPQIAMSYDPNTYTFSR